MFPTQTSIFTSEALEQQVLACYSLPQPVRCAFFRQGLNDTYLVETADSSHYLRIYRHNWRTQSQIEAEIAFLTLLHEAKLAISMAVAQRDGRTVTPIPAAEGTRYAVLFTAAPGQLHTNPTPGQSYALGQVTAQMHHIADAAASMYARPVMDATYFAERPFRNIQGTFGHLSAEMQLLTDVAHTVTTTLQNLSRTNLDYGLCHGDLHTGNVHFVDDMPTLFDFDCLGYSWRAYDLATFWWSRQLFEPERNSSRPAGRLL